MDCGKETLINHVKKIVQQYKRASFNMADSLLKNLEFVEIKDYTTNEELKELIDTKYLTLNSPQTKECFSNTFDVCISSHDIFYVEGYICDNLINIVVPHAWNKYNGEYFDLTIQETGMIYGKIISLNRKQLTECTLLTGKRGDFINDSYAFLKIQRSRIMKY